MKSPRRAPLEQVVERARARLASATGRRVLRRRAWIVLIVAAAVGAARPLLWPLSDEAPAWAGAPRALLLAALALALGLSALRILGRRRPSGVTAARAVDGALGLREVVASGYVFEHKGLEGPMIGLARARAEFAAREVDVRKALPLPSPLPGRGFMVALAPMLLVTAAVGAYDPALITALMSPPTDEEVMAASRLESAARELEGQPDGREAREAPHRPRQDGGPRPGASSRERRRRELVERARAAAKAARRGDRAEALRNVDALGREGREKSREAEALRAALRRIAEALDRTGRRAGARAGRGGDGEQSHREPGREASRGEGREGGREGATDSDRAGGESRRSPSGKALDPAEALRELARELRSGSGSSREATEEAQRMLSTLAAAAAEAARAATGDPEGRAARAAEAMERAAEAMARGDREAAARALEEAARTTSAMSEARAAAAREAEAIARLLEATGALERAMQLALAGRQGEPCEGGPSCPDGSEGRMAAGKSGRGGDGEGLGGEGAGAQALARALARRLAAMAPTASEVGPGAGGHIPDRGNAKRGRLEAGGTVRERAHVREGARAVKAIRGLGRSEEPGTEYSEVFPSYAAMAEESVQDEAVPAGRREAVRRYFEAIRPGGAHNSAEDGARGE